MKVEFTVPGIPMGKGRPRFMKNGHTYTPAENAGLRGQGGAVLAVPERKGLCGGCAA